jgi:hypothetical protein
MATNPFAAGPAKGKGKSGGGGGGAVKIAGSKNMTGKEAGKATKAASGSKGAARTGASAFAIPGGKNGFSRAYKGAANGVLNAGGTAADAHSAGKSADSASYSGR